MKKWICLLMSLLVLMSVFPAYALSGDELPQDAEKNRRALFVTGNKEKETDPGPDAAGIHDGKLDAAFDSGDPRLTETESSSVAAQASDFVFSDEAKAFLKETGNIDDLDAALAEALAETELGLLSKSPAGNSGLVLAGGTAIALYDGKYHYVYPSAKGVADEYSNLEKYYAYFISRISALLGEEGIVYSPDGKYAFICSKRITLMQMNLYIDPILLDLSTGEMILTATYPDRIMKDENAGAVTSAVFSSDNQSFYYVLYGRFGDARICLNRYDLGTGETESCFQSEKNLYYPHIAELEDGSILMLNDTARSEEAQGLVIASCNDGAWTLKEEKLRLEYGLFHATRLVYAPDAGLACLLGISAANNGSAVAFQLVSPEKDFDGIDTIWCIGKDTNDLIALSPDAYRESLTADVQNRKEDASGLSPLYPYQTILNAVFSPDGRYLLLHTVSNSPEGRSRNLFLVRLEDRTLRKVSGLDPEKIMVGSPGMNYPMNIEWNTEELIIGTDDGIKTFAFTAGK